MLVTMMSPRLSLLFVTAAGVLVLLLHLGLASHSLQVPHIVLFASGPLAPWLPELFYKPKSSHPARPFVRHIVAVGDLHSDMPNAKRVLQLSGVVDEHGDWTGNVDFFVQTGDIIDR
jgi:hypothetical protein